MMWGSQRGHPGLELHAYGHMAVRRVLSQERFADGFAMAPMVAQSSSLGSIDEEWLRQFRSQPGRRHRTASGESGTYNAVPSGVISNRSDSLFEACSWFMMSQTARLGL